MRVTWNMKHLAMPLAAALVFVIAAHAQTRPTASGKSAAMQAQQAGPDAMFDRWDKDKNKALSADEFKSGWQEVQAAAALRKLLDHFQAMDVNKSNGLEAAEYASLELIKRAGKSAPPMSTFDADRDLSLSFKEYVSLVQALTGKVSSRPT